MNSNPSADGGRIARLSVRTRFAIWMTGSYIVLFLALGTAFFLHQRTSLFRQLDAGLANRTAEVASAVKASPPTLIERDVRRLVQHDPQALLFSRMRTTLFDTDGRVIATSVFPAPTPPDADLVAAAKSDGQTALRAMFPGYHSGLAEWRLVLQRVETADGHFVVLVGGTEGEGVAWVLGRTLETMLVALLIGSFAAAIAAWGVGRLVHASLEDLRRIAGTLLPERIDEPVQLQALSPESAALQRDLQEVRERLGEALRSQERFISNASHELKTPIAVLLTEAQTLKMEKLPPAARRFVRSVTDEMRRLGRMAESFLTLTRLRSGRLENIVQLHPVNDILFDAIESCSRMAKQHRVHLIAELPDIEHELIVAGDADLLRVMLDNLIRNAIRFSPEGGRVVTTVRGAGDSCEICVRDYGPGVPQDLLASVFDRFSQAPDDCQRRVGHGLGLSIAQGVAELHGGHIRVENIPDGGCAFTVTLRVGAPSGGPDAAAAPHAQEQSPVEQRDASSAT